jgi:hypothetical protein
MRRTFSVATWILSLTLVLSSFFAQAQNCADAQKKFDAIVESVYSSGTPWTQVQTVFGSPTRVEETLFNTTILHYSYPGCSIKFTTRDGRVTSKSYALGSAAIFPEVAQNAAALPKTTPTELAAAIVSLQATANQLRDQLNQLDRAIQQLKATSTATQIQPVVGLPSAAVVVPAVPAVAATPAATSVSKPLCAENGSCYGDISDATGNPKTVSVQGYYRKDGTYVRGYYRSAPSSSSRKK